MARKCHRHPQYNALATCHYCGRPLCSDCVATGNGYYYCKNLDDCLAFQERGADTGSLADKVAATVTQTSDEEKGGAVSAEQMGLMEQLDHWAATEETENYYQKLSRKPRSIRDAIVMAEILTRPRFRRR